MSTEKSIQDTLMAVDRGDIDKLKILLLPQLKSLDSPQKIITFFTETIQDPFSGQTMFHLAGSLGKQNVLEFLLREVLIAENFTLGGSSPSMREIRSAIVNAQDKDDKWTCLFASVIGHPNLEITKLLVEEGGADLTIRDAYGGSVIETARMNENFPKEILDYLNEKLSRGEKNNDETSSDSSSMLQKLREENMMLRAMLEQEKEEHLMTKMMLVQKEKQLAELMMKK